MRSEGKGDRRRKGQGRRTNRTTTRCYRYWTRSRPLYDAFAHCRFTRTTTSTPIGLRRYATLFRELSRTTTLKKPASLHTQTLFSTDFRIRRTEPYHRKRQPTPSYHLIANVISVASSRTGYGPVESSNDILCSVDVGSTRSLITSRTSTEHLSFGNATARSRSRSTLKPLTHVARTRKAHQTHRRVHLQPIFQDVRLGAHQAYVIHRRLFRGIRLPRPFTHRSFARKSSILVHGTVKSRMLILKS